MLRSAHRRVNTANMCGAVRNFPRLTCRRVDGLYLAAPKVLNRNMGRVLEMHRCTQAHTHILRRGYSTHVSMLLQPRPHPQQQPEHAKGDIGAKASSAHSMAEVCEG